MGKSFTVLLTLAITIAILGTIGYLNFYKPGKTPTKATATENPAQGATTNPGKVSGISENEAVEKVRQLPEVKNFLATVTNTYVEVSSFDEESGTYLVQVFEIKDNHTATFGWWEVEKISGKVKKSI